ncbi:MAG: NADH-quinone oxidoreductase subunit M, partial [Nocardioidaceae bacterium]
MSVPWLTILALIPIVGAILVTLMPKGGELPKQLALAVSLIALAVSVGMAVQYEVDGGYQFVEQHEWIEAFGAHYAVGVDGLGLVLVLLTTILTPVVVLASWNDGDDGRWSNNAFFAWMLALEGLAIGVFMATDVFLFYVLFEATLIPIYFLIGGFGGARRSYAAVKFLLYSLFGGLLMLASVVGLYVVSADSEAGPSYLLEDLMALGIDDTTGRWLFLGFFIAFAVKAPMWPVHTWLPEAASEGTPGTSVLLVSVLDKIGTFGMMRFCLGIFPEASQWATPVVITLAVISVLYGALVAIGQNDMRRLIAYTSISHFGFIVLGIFVLNSQGHAGATLY